MLDAGSIVARLQLDDPTRVQQAQLFLGQLPKCQPNNVYGDKTHQLYQTAHARLENLMAGYTTPEPYFLKHMKETVDTMMRCLRDPLLPLLELQVTKIFYILTSCGLKFKQTHL